MKKYIIIFVLIAVLFSSGIVFAKEKIFLPEKLSFRVFDTSAYKDIQDNYWNKLLVMKFVDPDNGNICYISKNSYSGGISCLKNN